MLCIEKEIPRENLKHIPFVHADGSPRFQPIPHHVLADSIVNETNKIGLSIKSERWGIAHDDASLFGEIVLDESGVYQNPKDMEFTIGIRANNNKRFPVTLVSGTNVFVCSNMIIFGDFFLKKRHTIGLDLESEINSGLQNVLNSRPLLLDCVDEMKNTVVSEYRANDLMMKSAQTGLVSYSHLKEVHKEWKQPSYSDFNSRTEWSLYNCFNEVMKKYNPIRQQNSVGGLVELFSNN